MRTVRREMWYNGHMSKASKQLEKARAAKQKAGEIFRAYGTVVGVGITRRDDEYAVKVNFETPPPNLDALPTEIDGVPVVVQSVGTIRKQRDARKVDG